MNADLCIAQVSSSKGKQAVRTVKSKQVNKSSKNKKIDSPVKEIMEGSAQRTFDRNVDAITILTKYSARSFSSYASVLNETPLKAHRKLEYKVLLPLVVKSLKKEIIQQQIPYNLLQLQGFTPFQWYLLSKEIPSKNTFTFHRTLQFLEDLFLLPEVKPVAGLMNESLITLDKGDVCKGLHKVLQYFDENPSVQGKKQRNQVVVSQALDKVIKESSAKASLYLNGHGTSYNRMAVFFAVLADTLFAARQSKGDLSALGQLFAIFADLKLLTFRLAQCISQGAEKVPDGRIEDFIELAVREVLIYNTRLFDNGFDEKIVKFRKPPSSTSTSTSTSSSLPTLPHFVNGLYILEELELVQSRLLQIQSIQRRALRAQSEILRIRSKNPLLKDTPLWMYGDKRSHLYDLSRELDTCIFGDSADNVSPGSVEGLLFSPVMKAELMYLISLVPDDLSPGGGVISAKDEVYRLLRRIKKDHNSTIVPFLRACNKITGNEPVDTVKPEVLLQVTRESALNRIIEVVPMLQTGRTNPGALLNPGQMDALRVEDFKLWNICGIPSVSPDMVSTEPATLSSSPQVITTSFLSNSSLQESH